jgi:hypothetical protein
MNGELPKFLFENSTADHPAAIPDNLKKWFITEDNPATSPSKGLGMDTKMLLRTG